MLPRGQVTIRFVHRLVHNQEVEFLLGKSFTELAPVENVPPVGTGSWDVIAHLHLADHEQPGPAYEPLVLHELHVCPLKALLYCQIFIHCSLQLLGTCVPGVKVLRKLTGCTC